MENIEVAFIVYTMIFQYNLTIYVPICVFGMLIMQNGSKYLLFLVFYELNIYLFYVMLLLKICGFLMQFLIRGYRYC